MVIRVLIILLLLLSPTVSAQEACRVLVRRTVSRHPDVVHEDRNGSGWISLWARADGLLAVGRITARGRYLSETANGGQHSNTAARDYNFVCTHEAGKVGCSFSGYGTTFGAGTWTNMLGSVVMATYQAASASCADDPLQLKPDAWEMGNSRSTSTSIQLQIDIPLISGVSINVRSGALDSSDPNRDSTSHSADDVGSGAKEMGSCTFSLRSYVSVEGSVSGIGSWLQPESGHIYLDIRYQIIWARTEMHCSTHNTGKRVTALEMWGEDLLDYLTWMAQVGTPVPGPDGPLNYANGVGRGRTFQTFP